jgi:hypothetical protein
MVDLVTNNAKLVSDGYTKDGVVPGGFYFEWTDEWWKWWKADSNNPEYASKHVGDEVFTGHFPGCAYDHAWFGFTAIAPGGKKYLDTLTARPTIKVPTAEWSFFLTEVFSTAALHRTGLRRFLGRPHLNVQQPERPYAPTVR